ncbi:AAA family ATPase [Campylobacter vicugnae]|uniref:AAA family ATPase n=1 Tax=Campylobacter vicugnae TaxID=1660076 RepID=UPI000A339114|nr:ATP-binding protein [Campylobacter sp. S0112]
MNNSIISNLFGGGGTPNNYWFVAEDIEYYRNNSLISVEYNIPLIILPSQNELTSKFKDYKEPFGVLSTLYPDKEFENLFIVKELPNKYGILTTQEFEANINEDSALQKRLGLSVIKSPFGLSDVGGAKALKKFTSELLLAEQKGYKAKAIFLVGIPGTGKTFFPKCFAGETDRLLIQLNLTLIMEANEPIKKLNSIFEFLDKKNKQNPNEKYVILIDEIEKMIGNASPKEKQMLGRLLTILNDINTPACEYSFDGIFFATANNLNEILDNNPELLRRGRFDELFFINLPTYESAREIFKIYIKKFSLQNHLDNLNINIEDLIMKIDNAYSQENPIDARFSYTPSEIETFCKRLDFCIKAYGSLDDNMILECIELILPITLSAKQGIQRMVAQKILFKEI